MNQPSPMSESLGLLDAKRRAGRFSLLFAALLTMPFAFAGAAGDAGDYHAREAELQKLRARIAGLQVDLEATRGQQRAVSRQLQASDLRIGRLARRLRELGEDLQRQEDKLAGLARTREQKRRRLERHREVLARQVRAAFAMGRQERLKILLNQQDPVMVTRVMVYYDYLNRARAEHLAQIQLSLDRLREVEAEIAREEAHIRQLLSDQAEEKAQLEGAQAEREEVLTSLDEEIRGKGGQLRGLQQDARRLAELLSGLQRALADIPMDMAGFQPFFDSKGKLPWPARGRITVSFGTPRRGAGLRWDGVLISAPEGKEVRAVHHGRVAFADWLRGLGLLLIIDHGDGYMTLYGYNQTLFKETGEWVETGEPVALVGRSGGLASPGVYFGIRYKGKPVNPRSWCKSTKGRRVGKQGGAVLDRQA